MAIDKEVGNLETFMEGLWDFFKEMAKDSIVHFKVAQVDNQGQHLGLLEQHVLVNPSEVGKESEVAKEIQDRANNAAVDPTSKQIKEESTVPASTYNNGPVINPDHTVENTVDPTGTQIEEEVKKEHE